MTLHSRPLARNKLAVTSICHSCIAADRSHRRYWSRRLRRGPAESADGGPAPGKRSTGTGRTTTPQLEDQPTGPPAAMRAAQVTDQRFRLGADPPRVRLGAWDRSASPSIPPPGIRAIQRCTVCRATPYRSATSITGAPARTSSTARYLCSTTFSSRSMSGSVTHQVKPPCHTSSGAGHLGHHVTVRTFSTSSRLRREAAPPGAAGAVVRVEVRDLRRRPVAAGR